MSPRPLYIPVNIFTHDQDCCLYFILVIPSLNLVVSCPHVLYYLYMHTLCFLGALAQAFFCRQHTQGSYRCLNKHLYLVSCSLALFPTVLEIVSLPIPNTIFLDFPNYSHFHANSFRSSLFSTYLDHQRSLTDNLPMYYFGGSHPTSRQAETRNDFT